MDSRQIKKIIELINEGKGLGDCLYAEFCSPRDDHAVRCMIPGYVNGIEDILKKIYDTI